MSEYLRRRQVDVDLAVLRTQVARLEHAVYGLFALVVAAVLGAVLTGVFR
jgi:hypothetical protein